LKSFKERNDSSASNLKKVSTEKDYLKENETNKIKQFFLENQMKIEKIKEKYRIIIDEFKKSFLDIKGNLVNLEKIFNENIKHSINNLLMISKIQNSLIRERISEITNKIEEINLTQNLFQLLTSYETNKSKEDVIEILIHVKKQSHPFLIPFNIDTKNSVIISQALKWELKKKIEKKEKYSKLLSKYQTLNGQTLIIYNDEEKNLQDYYSKIGELIIPKISL